MYNEVSASSAAQIIAKKQNRSWFFGWVKRDCANKVSRYTASSQPRATVNHCFMVV